MTRISYPVHQVNPKCLLTIVSPCLSHHSTFDIKYQYDIIVRQLQSLIPFVPYSSSAHIEPSLVLACACFHSCSIIHDRLISIVGRGCIHSLVPYSRKVFTGCSHVLETFGCHNCRSQLEQSSCWNEAQWRKHCRF